MPPVRTARRVAMLIAAVFGAGHVAHAQSPSDGFNPGANDLIWTWAVQPDGRILAGGFFTTMGGGGTGTAARNRIARLNTDGSLDTSFNPGADNVVRALLVQPDGKILVGGGFTTLGGGGTGTTVRHRLGRLNADGSLDAGFNPDANLDVNAMALQADGKILIAGVFTTVGGSARSRLARLNPDGSVDPGFNPGADASVETIVLQPNGQIAVGGFFTHLGGGGSGGTVRSHIGRLNADGTLDPTFDPGADDAVFSLAAQPDGRLVAGGVFTNIGGAARVRLARLNGDGSADAAFDPGANLTVEVVALQPDGRILVGGSFTGLGGSTGTISRHRIGRLDANGSVDPSFDPGANVGVVALGLQPDGKILVGGQFATLGGGARQKLGRVYADGSLDADFNPGADFSVLALAPQPDGKIVVGGSFLAFGGGATTVRNRLARISAGGQVDPAYNPGANSMVLALAAQPDGKTVVGGQFGALGGGTGTITRLGVGRLNADGTVDPTFNPGMNGTVFALAVQPDGKVIVGGSFTNVGVGSPTITPRGNLARFNPDGSLDPTFNPFADAVILTIALQPDGKILVGGSFAFLGGGGPGGPNRFRIGRLNPDGSLDTTFDPGASASVNTIVVQPDGKILVGGQFAFLGGGGTGTFPREHIGRLNADGSIDPTFNPGANNNVFTMALQTDRRVLVGGAFTTLGGGGTGTAIRNRIARLNGDGTIDDSFNPGANDWVEALALEVDGKVMVGGKFLQLGGGGAGVTPRAHVARLTNTGPALQNLGVLAGGTAIGWVRSGTGPELEWVSFERSPDGTTYTPVGTAARSATGWQIAGLTLPLGTNLFIRARGYYSTSYDNGSGAIVEAVRNVVAVPCTYALASGSASVPSGVNAGSVMLTTNDPSCPWTAPSTAFITVTSDSAGIGSSLVRWVTAINPGPAPRTAALTIAGLTFTITQAGASTTRRVPNDFNHDAISDVAVYRPALGRWFVIGQPNTDWGLAGDLPVPGDYDGDGNPDIAVFRPSNGTWYVNGGATVSWGLPGDIPVPGDYNGDHVTDIAVFRPGAGQWLVRGIGTFTWGLNGDLPVQGDYNGDGTTEIAVYRPSTGTWFVRGGATLAWGAAADIPVPADYNGDGTIDIAVFRPASGVWYVRDQYVETWGAPGDVPVAIDRSGDGIAELGVFRRATGTWFFKNHVTDGNELVAWGAPGDIPLGRGLPPVATLAGDFDGERKADLTVFRPSTGDWVSLRSLSGFTDFTTHTFGLSGDIPVARDYDGDGKIDPAVFRPSTGRWFILRSSTNWTDYLGVDWGVSTDIPVPGDYDGDGRADVAVYRPSLGRWFIVLSSAGGAGYVVYDFGLSTDIPVPGDYDGDGQTDIAVFRPSTGRWFIYNRVSGTHVVQDWGLSGDVPAPADFDGDGRADVAVFRPSLGRWFIKSSIDGAATVADWGLSGDTMVPADFNGDGKADIAVFRPSTGDWYVRGQFNRSWGLAGDIAGIKIP